MLKCISGIEEFEAGEVIYDDINIGNLSKEAKKIFRRKNIGMVFQEYDLLPILNVRENILLPIKLNRMKMDKAYFDEIVLKLGIEEKLKQTIDNLSGGQKQRVAIARALITRPKLICADEPTGNLDSKNTLEVIRLFQKINKDLNATILMITHDHMLSEFTDTVINIRDGRLEHWK